MTTNQILARQQLLGFTTHIHQLIASAEFADGLALSLWRAMRPHIERHLQLLEEAAANIKALGDAEWHQFQNILEFSRTTLGWAETDDLMLIEALSDTSELLLKRLKAVNLIGEPQNSASIYRYLQAHTGDPTLTRRFVEAFVRQLTSHGVAQYYDSGPPSWEIDAALEQTPTPVGVYY